MIKLSVSNGHACINKTGLTTDSVVAVLLYVYDEYSTGVSTGTYFKFYPKFSVICWTFSTTIQFLN